MSSKKYYHKNEAPSNCNCINYYLILMTTNTTTQYLEHKIAKLNEKHIANLKNCRQKFVFTAALMKN